MNCFVHYNNKRFRMSSLDFKKNPVPPQDHFASMLPGGPSSLSHQEPVTSTSQPWANYS